MKTLIVLFALSLGLQAQAQSFKNLNALRSMTDIAQELETQAQFLSQMVSAEKDKEEAGTCYALGTLASSRARMQANARNLGAYSQQAASYLTQISRNADALSAICSETMSTSSALIQASPRTKTKIRANERSQMAQSILSSATALKQIVINAINN